MNSEEEYEQHIEEIADLQTRLNRSIGHSLGLASAADRRRRRAS